MKLPATDIEGCSKQMRAVLLAALSIPAGKMTEAQRCSKAGCGAQRRIGFPCKDWDCPQSYVIAAEYRLLLDHIEPLAARRGASALSIPLLNIASVGCAMASLRGRCGFEVQRSRQST